MPSPGSSRGLTHQNSSASLSSVPTSDNLYIKPAAYIPDYCVTAVMDLMYLKITRHQYLAARRATMVERHPRNGGIHHQEDSFSSKDWSAKTDFKDWPKTGKICRSGSEPVPVIIHSPDTSYEHAPDDYTEMDRMTVGANRSPDQNSNSSGIVISMPGSNERTDSTTESRKSRTSSGNMSDTGSMEEQKGNMSPVSKGSMRDSREALIPLEKGGYEQNEDSPCIQVSPPSSPSLNVTPPVENYTVGSKPSDISDTPV